MDSVIEVMNEPLVVITWLVLLGLFVVFVIGKVADVSTKE